MEYRDYNNTAPQLIIHNASSDAFGFLPCASLDATSHRNALVPSFDTLHETFKIRWQTIRTIVLIIIIIIITKTIFIVLSSTAPSICESSLWFLWTKVGQRQVAANS